MSWGAIVYGVMAPGALIAIGAFACVILLVNWIERRFGLEVAIVACCVFGIGAGWLITELYWMAQS